MSSLSSLSIILAVAGGGALGSVLRYSVGQMVTLGTRSGFPVATMMTNIVGSLMMGVVVAILLVRFPEHLLLKTFLTVGVLGGFTTFSTFSLDVVGMLERGEMGMAAVYTFGSIFFSVLALFAGLIIGRFGA